MKRMLISLFVFLNIVSAYSQDHVFVLVDVSRSVRASDLASAKQVLTDILIGSVPANVTVAGGTTADLASFKINANDKLAIVKFGDLQTSASISPVAVTMANLPGDIVQTMNNSFPLTPTDNSTYFKLAKAKIAEHAKSLRISTYKLYIISDEIDDNFSGGKPNYTSQYLLDLADEYNTRSNPVDEAPRVVVRINTSTPGFKLNFCPGVDITNYSPPNAVVPPTGGSTDSTATITIKSYPNGTKAKPISINGSSMTLSWACANCPPETKFNVVVAGGKFRPKIPVLSSYSYSINNIPDGEYRITVSTNNLQVNTSAFTYIKVSTGGGSGWIWPVLILLIAAVAGYMIWNRRRQKKLEEEKGSSKPDIFTRPATGGNSGSNTGNSGSGSGSGSGGGTDPNTGYF